MNEIDKKKTGTTTVGIAYKDGVILAAESKSTLGWLVSGKEVQKIHQIDDKMALTISGSVGDAQSMIRMLKAEINIYKLTRNAGMTVRGVATLLSNILSQSRWYPYMFMPILGGVDKNGPHVLSIDPVGGVEEDRYTSTGSGSPVAYGVLEDLFKKDMSKDEAMKVAVRAIRSARERDVMSGGKKIMVVAIDENKLEFINEEKVNEIIETAK